jgi:hypothetical protein
MSCLHLMCRPLHVSHAGGIGFIVWRLERYAHALMGYHDDNAIEGYLFTLTAHRALYDTWRLQSCPEPKGGSWCHGTRGGSEATLSQDAGAGATGHVMALKLP